MRLLFWILLAIAVGALLTALKVILPNADNGVAWLVFVLTATVAAVLWVASRRRGGH